MSPVSPNRLPPGRHSTTPDQVSGAYDAGIVSDLEACVGRPRLLDLMERLRAEIGMRLGASPAERETLAHDAHVLVSVSGTLGFLDLSQACDGLGRACRDELDLAAALDRAGQAARTARDAIDHFLIDREPVGDPA